MLRSTQLKTNTYFLYQKNPYKVLKYKHTHLSRRGATIKVKIENLKTGKILNLSLGSNEKFEEAEVEKKEMQFLYRKDRSFYFMDPQNFNQISISEDLIGNNNKFLKPTELVNVLFYQNEALGIDLPPSIMVEIVEAPPGVKGNSAVNVFKTGKTKNNLTVKIPLFIKPGDKIKIDTKTGEYLEKA